MSNGASVGGAGDAADFSRQLSGKAVGLDDLLTVLVEAGLYSKGAGDSGQILNLIQQARNEIAAPDLPQAAKKLSEAEIKLNNAVHAKGHFWRFVHLHRPFLFLYLVVALTLLFLVASGWWTWLFEIVLDVRTKAEFDAWGVPSRMLGIGACGAILRSLYWLHRQVARRVFRVQFVLAHLASPFIGALFGMFTFYLLSAGLLVLQDGSTPDLENGNVAAALVFLAGFSWERVLTWVDKIRLSGRGS